MNKSINFTDFGINFVLFLILRKIFSKVIAFCDTVMV